MLYTAYVGMRLWQASLLLAESDALARRGGQAAIAVTCLLISATVVVYLAALLPLVSSLSV